MTTETQAILQQALRLSAVERAELIEALFRSFDKTGDRRVDALWAKEVESRIDAYEAGKMKADSVDNALKRINDKRGSRSSPARKASLQKWFSSIINNALAWDMSSRPKQRRPLSG